MSAAHVCDECKTVAPIDEAIHWWSVQALDEVLMFGEKPEYHFCSWACLSAYAQRHHALFYAGQRGGFGG